LTKYAQFALLEQIVDIQPLVERDKVPTDIYFPGLTDLWIHNGKRYGLPKDWDTEGIMYNVDMLKKAGIDPEIMKTWTWNPKDGGTFGEVIAKLTLDANGNNGLSPNFDKTKVVQYGFNLGSKVDGMGAMGGQHQWSSFAVSNGFKYVNGLWGNRYYYDDPKLAETIQWIVNLWLKKGYTPTYPEQLSLGKLALFQAKKVAMDIDGSWTLNGYLGSSFPVAFGRLPAGPLGRRSMFGTKADSIYVGTKHLEEAWKWVKYLASSPCEDIIGESGVIFPAIPEATDKFVKAREAKSVDVSGFVEQANEKDGTFLFPITDHGAEIYTIMRDAMDRIALGKAEAAPTLKDANDQVNALFNQ
jgi:multiple sugar transport system substrate-binding protein